MLDHARVMDERGLKIGICSLEVQSGLTMLASLIEKYKAFKGLDSAFGLFLTDQGKIMVIGRSDPRGVDVGGIVRKLGGGGHPAAGAAVVKGKDPAAVEKELTELIQDSGQSEIPVRVMMSDPAPFVLSPKASMEKALAYFKTSNTGAAVVADKDRFMGLLPLSVVEKAEKNKRLSTPVKGGLNPRPSPSIPRTQPERQWKMNLSPEGLLPVIEDDRLVGILTRGNLILHIYDI